MNAILCDLDLSDYDEMLALWERAGLSVRAEGRDAPEAFARQMARGTQRVVGLRAADDGGQGNGALMADSSGQAGGPLVADASVQAKGPLVAIAVLTHDGRKGWINRLAVDPCFRRQGLAQRLIAEAERWFAADLGLEVFSALIAHDNEASQALFRGEGYGTADAVYVSRKLHPNA